jgi:hypothetical protein
MKANHFLHRSRALFFLVKICDKMNDLTQYKEFLKSKVQRVTEAGFTVDESMLNKNLFDFQRYIVAKALKMGKYAVFADCGLGKTLMQLEWAHHVSKHTGKPVLILCPLAVAGQTIKEGEKFGIKVQRFVVNETVKLQSTIYITNYDQLDNVNPDLFSGIVLDESGIIKNHEGATKNLVIDKFQYTPYKLACTATPSPNDFMELGNHSEFLNIMPRNEMLAMYFVHDGGETAKWRLKGHSEKIFWKWVASWAVMLTKPSDIGFSADGYDLPSLNYIEKQIVTSKRDNGTLFNDVAVSATDFNGELRLTKVERMSEVVEIVNNSDETFIIWIKHNDEGDYLKRLIPDAVEVRGNDSIKYKEDTLLEFADGKHRVLITKSKIAQYGLNFQKLSQSNFCKS